MLGGSHDTEIEVEEMAATSMSLGGPDGSEKEYNSPYAEQS